MALLLHIETATFNGSIAISRDNTLLDCRELRHGEKHIKTLAPAVRSMLEDLSLQLDDVSAVAVSAGPGSYTGLRIGLAFCKGICAALQIPLIAVPTLQIIAEAVFAKHDCDLAIPMLDARRLEVYYAVYDSAKNEVESARSYILEPSGLSQYSGKSLVVAGNATHKAENILSEGNFLFDQSIELSAKHMVSVANEKHASGTFVNLSDFEPTYLKDFLIGKSNKIANILRGK